MSIIRTAFWAIVAICLIVMGLANRGMVTLRALPETLAEFAGVSPDIEMPLFVVIFVGVALGLLIGFVWEWIREHHVRAEARARQKKITLLEREVERLRADKHKDDDQVMALLDRPAASR